MRLIDEDALRHRLFCQTKNLSVTYVLELVSTMPTVDAVEVVRCKDCVYCGWNSLFTDAEREEIANRYNADEVDFVCRYWESDGFSLNDYCSFARPKEDYIYCHDCPYYYQTNELSKKKRVGVCKKNDHYAESSWYCERDEVEE